MYVGLLLWFWSNLIKHHCPIHHLIVQIALLTILAHDFNLLKETNQSRDQNVLTNFLYLWWLSTTHNRKQNYEFEHNRNKAWNWLPSDKNQSKPSNPGILNSLTQVFFSFAQLESKKADKESN